VRSLDVELIGTLRASEVHLPATDLAAQLRVPLATIQARIAGLQEAGFEIEVRPSLGYRLLSAPDRLVADDLLARQGACPLVREIVVFEETGSTNDLVMQRGRQQAASGLAIFAERQTAGRGRFARRWDSASHRGLWFSMLLRPELPFARWPRLTTWAAVSVAAAIEKTLRVQTRIKWPNDLYISNRKIAGILIEGGVDQAGQNFACVGIGVNVNQTPEEFPPELAGTAGSLRMFTGSPVDRSALAVAIFSELNGRFAQLEADFDRMLAEATDRSTLLGRWIQVRSGDATIEGMAEALVDDGCLLLRKQDGVQHTLRAGEVTLSQG
jgi:BirA family transcriptional regulator, biotin operon repressor / biotin---[acetyl-CoA-carboxylase] ligase